MWLVPYILFYMISQQHCACLIWGACCLKNFFKSVSQEVAEPRSQMYACLLTVPCRPTELTGKRMYYLSKSVWEKSRDLQSLGPFYSGHADFEQSVEPHAWGCWIWKKKKACHILYYSWPLRFSMSQLKVPRNHRAKNYVYNSFVFLLYCLPLYPLDFTNLFSFLALFYYIVYFKFCVGVCYS